MCPRTLIGRSALSLKARLRSDAAEIGEIKSRKTTISISFIWNLFGSILFIEDIKTSNRFQIKTFSFAFKVHIRVGFLFK